MNGPLLVIDAATYRGSVAVVAGSVVLSEGEALMRGEREERLMPAVATALADARLHPGDLAAVVCGAGPGSFTSLRIAASIAKAMALAGGAPLCSVSSLLLVIAGPPDPPPAGRYLAVLDAMREEVFVARGAVANDGVASLDGAVELVDAARAAQIALEEGRTLVGPGRPQVGSPHARGVARIGRGPQALRTVDLTSWEPDYGRRAEAQVQWERKHGRSLTT